jgi:hypothetical protein
MKRNLQSWWTRQRTVLVGAFVTGLCLLSGFGIGAQVEPKKEEEKAKDKKSSNVVRSGFTRPGTPTDPMGKDGVIRPVAWDLAYKEKILGGTLYFAVLQRKPGSEDDPWATGITDFVDRFTEGRSFKNTYSPALDTKANYLYLYMVVNDRGLDPTKDHVALAADIRETFDYRMLPIANSAVKLQVDPRYITSWGYFKNTSFTVEVRDTFEAEHKPVADNQVQKIRLAMSANTSYLELIPERERQYIDGAPAISLGKMERTFAIGPSNVNGTKSNLYKALAAKRDKAKKDDKSKLAAYEDNLMKVGEKGGLNPDFVQLIYSGFSDSIPPDAASTTGETTFRVDFRGKNAITLGEQSVLFGFTSDLSPTDDKVRIEDPEAAKQAEGMAEDPQEAVEVADVQFVAFMQQGQGASAWGVGASPAPTGALAMGSGLGTMGGGSGAGTGGGPGGGVPLAGGIGFARPGFFGGGGITGTGGGTQTQQQAQNQTQTPNININITNTNSQNQQQSQQQQQQQQQSQSQNGGGAVPAPPALLLGLLGLPALFLLRRRGETTAA